jgi:hypothetical protein
MGYAVSRRGEQLRKMAVMLMPDDTYKALRVSGPMNVDFNSQFAKCLALYATALDIPAAAIVCEVWFSPHPLAPGQRPSQQADRQEAILICAQGRMASPINVMIPIIDGCSVPLPQILPEGYETFTGFGRFITSCAPGVEERESAQALLTRLGAGKDTPRIEISPHEFAKVSSYISLYNPDAKPQQW